MDNYNFKLDIEPNNDYEKARKSLIEALNDFQKLESNEKERLLKEIFTAEVYNQAISTLLQFNNPSIK